MSVDLKTFFWLSKNLKNSGEMWFLLSSLITLWLTCKYLLVLSVNCCLKKYFEIGDKNVFSSSVVEDFIVLPDFVFVAVFVRFLIGVLEVTKSYNLKWITFILSPIFCLVKLLTFCVIGLLRTIILRVVYYYNILIKYYILVFNTFKLLFYNSNRIRIINFNFAAY